MNYLDKIQVIDHKKLEYFIAFRLAMALLEGLDGQEWWTQPEIVRTIVNELKERTGITVKSDNLQELSLGIKQR
jgi:hypothetical protein